MVNTTAIANSAMAYAEQVIQQDRVFFSLTGSAAIAYLGELMSGFLFVTKITKSVVDTLNEMLINVATINRPEDGSREKVVHNVGVLSGILKRDDVGSSQTPLAYVAKAAVAGLKKNMDETKRDSFEGIIKAAEEKVAKVNLGSQSFAQKLLGSGLGFVANHLPTIINLGICYFDENKSKHSDDAVFASCMIKNTALVTIAGLAPITFISGTVGLAALRPAIDSTHDTYAAQFYKMTDSLGSQLSYFFDETLPKYIDQDCHAFAVRMSEITDGMMVVVSNSSKEVYVTGQKVVIGLASSLFKQFSDTLEASQVYGEVIRTGWEHITSFLWANKLMGNEPASSPNDNHWPSPSPSYRESVPGDSARAVQAETDEHVEVDASGVSNYVNCDTPPC